MPSSDYASAVGGGLKLKGVKNGGVEKKKKKKKAKAEADSSVAHDGGEDKEDSSAVQKALAEEDEEDHDDDSQLQKMNLENAQERDGRDFGKTEAQRRHEERRRKRLDERLKREGVKSHKERVQELNKYLSNLSEHHDMPRIGPG